MNSPSKAVYMTKEQQDHYDSMEFLNNKMKAVLLVAENHELTQVVGDLTDAINNNEFEMECFFNSTGANEC